MFVDDPDETARPWSVMLGSSMSTVDPGTRWNCTPSDEIAAVKRLPTRWISAIDSAACGAAEAGSAGMTAASLLCCVAAKTASTCSGWLSWERANAVVRSFVPAVVSWSMSRSVEITREPRLPPNAGAPVSAVCWLSTRGPSAAGLSTSDATSCRRVRANCRCRSPLASVEPAAASCTRSTPRLTP